jgi:hypothetical protein
MRRTLRIRTHTLQLLQGIARATGQSIEQALEDAVDQHARDCYWNRVNRDYAALMKDARARKSFEEETTLWGRTNTDGLENL